MNCELFNDFPGRFTVVRNYGYRLLPGYIAVSSTPEIVGRFDSISHYSPTIAFPYAGTVTLFIFGVVEDFDYPTPASDTILIHRRYNNPYCLICQALFSIKYAENIYSTFGPR